jgi:asparagine synthase (glutamine-hydrolysing)
MGALAILLSRDGAADPEAARRMLSAAPHRGDDCVIERTGGVTLAVCNDPAWVTATLAKANGHAAAFCGTLDNEAELRADLARAGATEPVAGTAAATVLAAFRLWGDDAVARFRGSFSGAVTDGSEVRCFRDHFGTRPLFHHEDSRGFVAATEVKQVLAGASLPGEPDLDHLHGLLFGGMGESTAYRGVRRLPPQTLISVGSRPGLTLSRYWDPASLVETRRASQADAIEGTLEALERAVRRTLTGADVILLSGGLDAPSIAALAARAPGLASPVQAATAIYPEHPSADESEWTRMAAEHVGMALDPYVARAGSMDDVDHWIRVLDGPVDVVAVPESAESYRAARALGARTVLTGEMAESVFAMNPYLLDHLLSHGRFLAAYRELAMHGRGKRPKWFVRRILRAVAPAALLAENRGQSARWVRSLPPWVSPQRMLAVRANRSVSGMGPRQRWKRLQTAQFSGMGLTFETDEICAAWCGVNSRRPFADVDLWEYVLSLPAEVKFPARSTKPLLRAAMRGILPDELIDRKDKTYFDEFHLATADYPTLKRLLVQPRHRLEGIDYDLLRDRLEAGDMRVYELQWARNVARVHAFLNQW